MGYDFLWWDFSQHTQFLPFLCSLAAVSTLVKIFEILNSVIVYIYASNNRSVIMAFHPIDGFSNGKIARGNSFVVPLRLLSL